MSNAGNSSAAQLLSIRARDDDDSSNQSASRSLSFPQRAARSKINRLADCIATSHHAVAVRKFNEATVHLSSRENAARLALTVLSVPSVGVREVLHLLRPPVSARRFRPFLAWRPP